MQFFVGIDGGGTSTRAFLTDPTGQQMAWAEAGLSNPVHAAPGQTHSNLREAIEQATARLGISLAQCVSVFAGMAGVTTPSGRAALTETLEQCGLEGIRIGVDHDIRIALAGGLAGKPGIALIVGTGSSCYGRTSDGRHWQTGGWEALIADEGSGFFLGREAIAAAARMADGRTPESPLRHTVFEWLEIEQIAEILPRVHQRGLARTDIAAFAPRVIELAERGDAAACAILDQGAELLGDLVRANHRQLATGPKPDVVITGGLGTTESLYRRKIVAAIRARLPSAEIHHPVLPPVVGAAMLALEQAGQTVSESFLAKMREVQW